MAAATQNDLTALHRLVTDSLSSRIKQDMEDNIPTDAATLGAAIKFLKDNSITADPSDADDLRELQRTLAEQARARRKAGDTLQVVEQDMYKEA